jgi:hypothetical protein
MSDPTVAAGLAAYERHRGDLIATFQEVGEIHGRRVAELLEANNRYQAVGRAAVRACKEVLDALRSAKAAIHSMPAEAFGEGGKVRLLAEMDDAVARASDSFTAAGVHPLPAEKSS